MTHAISAACLVAIVSFLAAQDPADSDIPIVREVIYKNAHHIPQKELDSLSGIRAGDPLDLDANRAACVRIQDYLKKKGRYWATVSLAKGNVASDTQVIFIVSEGPIVRVRSTQFAGNKTQATQNLQKLIAPAARAFEGMGRFNENTIADQVSILEEYYRGLGYRDVKVNREISFSADQSQVDVIYTIVEGPRYREITDERGMLRVRYDVRELAPGKVGRIYVLGNADATQQQQSVSLPLRYPELRITSSDTSRAGFFTLTRDEGPKTPDNDKAPSSPMPGVIPCSPGPGFIRLPGQDVPSDFVAPEVRIPGAKAVGQAERTTVKFTRPIGMKATIFSTEAADGFRPNSAQDTRGFAEGFMRPEPGPGTIMFGAGINSSSGVLGSIVLNERNFDLFRCCSAAEPRPAGTRYQLAQGQTHRVEFTDIDRLAFGCHLNATLEVMAPDGNSEEFLSRNAIPIALTDEDFKNVIEAGTVVKIYYLPNLSGPMDDDNGSSVRVVTHPGWAIDGIDPIQEVRQRGSVLLVLRMGVGQIFSASLAASPPPAFNSSPPEAYGRDVVPHFNPFSLGMFR